MCRNVSDVGDQFPKVVSPETNQINTAVFNDSSVSVKNSESFSYRRCQFKRMLLF